jgi:hypothetical protein
MAGIITAAAITAAATITVGVIKDQTQKKANNAQIAALQADTKLQLLNSTQKQALDYRIANAKNDTDRLKAYEDAISKVSSATQTSIGTIYAAGVSSTSQQNYIQKSALLAGGIMLVGGTIYVLRKK